MATENVSSSKVSEEASSQARSSRFIEESSGFLDAMANSSRLEILTHLVDKEISVGDLSERVGLSQSALSQHLAKLRSAKLVTTRRAAQTIYYTCSSIAALHVLELLKEFFPG